MMFVEDVGVEGKRLHLNTLHSMLNFDTDCQISVLTFSFLTCNLKLYCDFYVVLFI